MVAKPALKTLVITSNLSSIVWRCLASVQVYERVLIIWVALEIFRCDVFTLKLYIKDNEIQLITLENAQ